MRLLISGYRDYQDRNVIEHFISQLSPIDVVVLGGCPTGVDKVAKEIATEKKYTIEEYLPDWSKGKSAGPIRNELMITKGKPDYALLFLSSQSRGTLNMLRLIQKYKIKYTLIHI